MHWLKLSQVKLDDLLSNKAVFDGLRSFAGKSSASLVGADLAALSGLIYLTDAEKILAAFVGIELALLWLGMTYILDTWEPGG